MPANIESYVGAREDAWHQLGTTLPDSFTAQEALHHGLLGGWNVRKTPLYTQDPNSGQQLTVPGRNAVVRDNPATEGQVDVLGNVSHNYQVIQNEEHTDLLDAIVDEGGAHFETAGSLSGGRLVFVTMKLPSHMEIGGEDQVDNYLAAVNSHDGSKAFTIMVTPIRIVCQNTMNLALKSSQQQFRVRHTSGATKHIVGQARSVLDLSFKYLDTFQQEADRLIQTELSENRFEEIIQKEFGPEEDAAPQTVTRCQNKTDRMMQLFTEANTQKEIRNTSWAGLGALTEYADHFAPTRGDDTDQKRYHKAVLDNDWKNRALQLMQTA